MNKSTHFQSLIKCLLITLSFSALSQTALAGWSGSGQGTQVSGVWYALYETGEQQISASGSGGSHTYNLSAPGASLSFDARRNMRTGVGSLKVSDGSNTLYDSNPAYDYESVTNKTVNVNATSIVFSASLGSYKKYFKNVKVTMAQYVDAPSKTSIAFGTGKVDDANTTSSFTIAWCNVPAMTWSVSGPGSDQIAVSVTNNAEAGKYNTATFTVTYKRNVASTLDAMLTIKDGNGNNAKSITLTGSTTKYDQTLSWQNEETILTSMMIGSDQPVMAVGNPSGLNASSFTSSDKKILTVSNAGVIVAVAEGEATITANQAGNYKYNAAAPITKTITVFPKATPVFTENGFSTSSTCELKVGEAVTLNVAEVSAGLNGDFTVTASTGDIMGVSREGNIITLSALHAGTTSITVAQAGNATIYPLSKTYTFNVTRYTPEFTLSANALELEQTATLTLNHVDGQSISFAPEGIVSYNANNGVITAVAPGTTTLTVSQAQTNAIEAKSESFTITVSKKTPSLTVKMNNAAHTSLSVYQGNTASVSFEKVSDGEIVVTNVSGAQYATYDNGTLHASSELGTARFRATLSETDTYASTYVEFTITVLKDNRHLPITMSSDLWNNGNFKVVSEGDNSWDNSKEIVLGNTGSGGFNWDDKYVILHFEGIPDKLSFQIATKGSMGGPTSVEWYVQESASQTMNGNNIWTSSYGQGTMDFGETHTIQLQPTTRYIKLCYSGNFGGYIKNLHISELKYVEDPSPASIDFGTAVISSGVVEKTTNINWCNIAPMTVTSSNPRFTVTPASFANYEVLGSQELTIRFEHTNEIGAQEADITVSNGNATYTKTIHVTANTIKRPQEIVWNADLVAANFAMNVDESYPDATIATIATTANGERITFESDNSDIIEIIEDTIIYAKSAGTAHITARQAGDAQYQAAEDTKEFTVTMLQKQTITWNQNLLGLLTTSGSVELTATATSGGAITYVSANENIVKVNGNILTVVGEGETTVTATQAGGIINEQEWLGISQSHTVIVRDPASQCNERALFVGSITLNASHLSEECILEGTPTTLTCSASHGTKPNGAWFQKPTYAALMIDQYTKVDGVWGWDNIYNAIVGEDDSPTSISVALSENATKIRFRTTENETTHSISNIQVPRKKYMRADITSVDAVVESNAIWSKTITVTHSNIDVMTLSSKQNLLTLSSMILGDGCQSYGDDQFTASFTPTQKNKEYKDTIVITDNKAQPTTILIPVRLYAEGLNQSISGFSLPATAVATDEIFVNAVASSELPVSYSSSDANIAYVENGQLVILHDGTVTITASQEGNDKYNAAQSVAQTIVISKAQTSITTAPTAADITYGQALSESALTNGVGSVEGTFVWETPDTKPAAGTPNYNVVFVPTQSGIYATATTLVTVRVEKADPQITTLPTASDITIAQGLSDSELTNGEANVPGTFAWKNASEHRLKAGEYQRTVVFTPTDNANYNSVEFLVNITVINVLARIDVLPTAVIDNAVYGITLADVALLNGEANVEGTFSWEEPTTVPQVGTFNYPVLFTPEDLELYSIVSVEVSLTVGKATPVIETLPVASEITYGQTLSASALTDGQVNNNISGTFVWKNGEQVLTAGEHTELITFVPAETGNYNSVDAEVTVKVNAASAEWATVPAAIQNLVYTGNAQTLIAAGEANGGTVEYSLDGVTYSTELPQATDAADYTVYYRVAGDANHNDIEPATTSVNIAKASATITTVPAATAITYGQTLAAATLNGGEGSVNGTFAWEDETIAPNAGTRDYKVLFIPTDANNYDGTDGMVSVTINKAATEVTTDPTAEAITYGQTLAEATLSGGAASQEGSFAWADNTVKPNAGTASVEVVFTPNDADNYLSSSTTIELTVNKATPVITWPTANSMSAGHPLSDAALLGGTNDVEGTFAWEDGTEVINETGSYSRTVVFTPADADNYLAVSETIEVTVGKAHPTITAWPTASNITYGQLLSASTLSDGQAVGGGTFEWKDGEQALTAGQHQCIVVFTPNDLENFSAISNEINVTVNQATPVVTVAPTASSLKYNQTLADAVLEGGESSVEGTFAWANNSIVPEAGTKMFDVVFTPADAVNYTTTTVSVSVLIERAIPEIITAPVTTVDLQYGQTLAEALMNSGLGSVPGTFTWEEPTTTPTAGVHNYVVIFTPTDSDNYDPVTTTISVTINKAPTSVITVPANVTMHYGQTLAEVELIGGEGSVAGTFVWADGTEEPEMGEGDYEVIFQPADEENYAPSKAKVHVVIGKGIPAITQCPTTASVVYGKSLADVKLQGGRANIRGSFAWEDPTIVPTAGNNAYKAVFTPSTANEDEFDAVTFDVYVTVEKATPEVLMWPTAWEITEGDQLAQAAWMSDGEATVEGRFEWKESDLMPTQGTNEYAVVFIPTDELNYNTVESMLEVIVKVQNITTDVENVESAGELKAIYTISGQLITLHPENFIPTQGAYIFMYDKGARKVMIP